MVHFYNLKIVQPVYTEVPVVTESQTLVFNKPGIVLILIYIFVPLITVTASKAYSFMAFAFLVGGSCPSRKAHWILHSNLASLSPKVYHSERKEEASADDRWSMLHGLMRLTRLLHGYSK